MCKYLLLCTALGINFRFKEDHNLSVHKIKIEQRKISREAQREEGKRKGEAIGFVLPLILNKP